jgi:hypothetical protein
VRIGLGELVMDAVTVIETALAAGAGAGMKDTATQAVKDAYAGLKALVLRLVEDQPTGVVAVVEHEKDPEVWRAPLAKTLTAVGADQDRGLIDAAQRLLQLLDPEGARAGAYTVNVTATGDRSVAAHTIHGGVQTGDAPTR